MNGFVVFSRKELLEFVRGWRLWVLASVLGVFALTGPVTARYLREILGAALGDQGGGLPLPPMPEPTYVDAYLQWTKNLGDLVLILVVVLFAGVICGECRQGTAVLMLTKPLRRSTFVLAKAVTAMAVVAASVAAGTVLTWLVTRLLFPVAPVGPLVAAVGSWLLTAGVFIAVTVLASAWVQASGAAAGIALAAYLLSSVAGVWAPLRRVTPAGLQDVPGALAAGQPVEAAGPALAAVASIVCLLSLAVWVFNRREL